MMVKHGAALAKRRNGFICFPILFMEKRYVVPRPRYVAAMKSNYRKTTIEAFSLVKREEGTGKNLVIKSLRYETWFKISSLPTCCCYRINAVY